MRMLVHASPSLIIAPPEKLKSALEVSKSKDGGQNFPGITIKSSNICHTPHSSCQQTQPELEEQAEENFEVACPCGVNCDDGVMILCDGCEKWQHAVCFRIIDDSDIPKSHLCNICAETKPELLESGSKTDQTLTGLTEEQAKSVCLFRRAVLLCVDNDLLSVGIISKRLSIETNIARGLLNRLQDEGAVKDVRGRGGNKAVLKAHVEAILLPRFFSLSTESHNVQDEAKQLGKRAAATKGKRGGGTSEMSSLASATEDLQIGNEISILSQESTDSPRPSKRRRTYNTVNTPIPVAPH
uniref:PHD domain-containing protein n=1 Tax=Mesocestoides corti TaxID=53468 RepID=A0A5K3EUC8_MESCO